MSTAVQPSTQAAMADRAPSAAGAAAAFVFRTLADALRRCSASSLLAVSVSAPVVAIDAALDSLPASDRLLWDPPAGIALATAGTAEIVRAGGRSRFSGLAKAARAMYDRLIWGKAPDAGAPPPRLVGGLAFAPGHARAAPWADFGDAAFALPAWTYGLSRGRAFLTICARADSCDPRRAADATGALLVELSGHATARARPAPAITEVRALPRSEWRARIHAALDAISRGEAQKLVAARITEVDAAAEIDPLAVVAALERRHRGCFRFSITRGDTAFVGATPEALIARRGTEIATEALAGSMPADADAGALFDSDKNRREHQLVVGAITQTLSPFCGDLHWPATPTPRSLHHVVHLRTPIAGTLRRPVHILELCAALHPTPAVGGIPGEDALAWIERTESRPRGWYAAPVGWFDAAGDGELAVAIRSAAITGSRALLYAGAGIVDGSDPDDEYDETAIKERAILDALTGQ